MVCGLGVSNALRVDWKGPMGLSKSPSEEYKDCNWNREVGLRLLIDFQEVAPVEFAGPEVCGWSSLVLSMKLYRNSIVRVKSVIGIMSGSPRSF